MILTLFLTLLALSVVVGILGYVTGDEPYLTVGLFLLFLLSLIILTSNLEYETGASVNATTVDNSTITTITYNYTPWNDNTSHKVGWGLAVMSFLGVALSLYNTSMRRRDE